MMALAMSPSGMSPPPNRFKPPTFRPAPLFEDGPEPTALPHKRAGLGGYRVGDLVWLWVPGQPGRKRPARVINIFYKAHLLLLKAERPETLVELNPLVHPALLQHRFESATP